jgi:NAD-reducing hydrogenase large subunit
VFKAYTKGKPNNMSMHMHWARLIEILHSAEVIRDLLNDPDLLGDDLVTKGEKQKEGVGLIEAPRGTLFHHYRINDHDQIEMANLIVSTTHNNEPMNLAVNLVAKSFMEGQKEITEPMMNAVEVAIRAYDPCLSCATHALGKMPLEFKVLDASDNVIDHKTTFGS